MSKNQPINHGIGMPTDPEDAQCRLVWLNADKKVPCLFNGYFLKEKAEIIRLNSP